MSPDSPPAAIPAPDTPASTSPSPPGLIELFVAFAKMSLAGFGGVLVWARRGIVDQHKWMTADEFNTKPSRCAIFLPGPNIVKTSAWCSDRAFAGFPAASRPLARPGRAPPW